jgi:23S rRNA (uracil1939-C5)-methyltransferase
MDSLGQGVSKLDNRIIFVPKTLPGERGLATVYRSKGKVSFAQLDQITAPSPHRIKPECEYFAKCGGCQYLHTDYQHEFEFKLAAFNRDWEIFLKHNSNISFSKKISLHPAQNRFGYRNRIQLHYNVEKKQLGLHQADSNIIENTEKCLVAGTALNQKLTKLLTDQHWLSILPSEAPKIGHIELYEQRNNVSVSFNQNYASQGFSQINSSMNQKLKNCIKQMANGLSADSVVIDLFGGNGNLSEDLVEQKVYILDQFTHAKKSTDRKTFVDINLYGSDVLNLLQKKFKGMKIDLLILDPPRTGLSNLAQFLKILKPRQVAYISCNYQTQLRDLNAVQKDQKININEVLLFDFFPGTKHLETLCYFDY